MKVDRSQQALRVLNALQQEPDLLRATLEIITQQSKTLFPWASLTQDNWVRQRALDNGAVAEIIKVTRTWPHNRTMFIWTAPQWHRG